MASADPVWRKLALHAADWPEASAFDNTGKRIAARIAMIARTTSNSMRVKPVERTRVARRSQTNTERGVFTESKQSSGWQLPQTEMRPVFSHAIHGGDRSRDASRTHAVF